MQKIGPQHGLEARRLKENEYHPGIAAWDKSAATFKTLVDGHNEAEDRLTALEEWARLTPFPFEVPLLLGG